MAAVIAREVRDRETVAVGTLSPIPAAGVLLASRRHAPGATVIIINHDDHWPLDRKSTRLNSSHIQKSRMPSSA